MLFLDKLFPGLRSPDSRAAEMILPFLRTVLTSTYIWLVGRLYFEKLLIISSQARAMTWSPGHSEYLSHSGDVVRESDTNRHFLTWSLREIRDLLGDQLAQDGNFQIFFYVVLRALSYPSLITVVSSGWVC